MPNPPQSEILAEDPCGSSNDKDQHPGEKPEEEDGREVLEALSATPLGHGLWAYARDDSPNADRHEDDHHEDQLHDIGHPGQYCHDRRRDSVEELDEKLRVSDKFKHDYLPIIFGCRPHVYSEQDAHI
tara:strand:- start:76 stop:459 length:384 start_codon:yes stop_codon:yes gene_type:complete